MFGLLGIVGLDLSQSGLKTFSAGSSECEVCALILSNLANFPISALEPFPVREYPCQNSRCGQNYMGVNHFPFRDKTNKMCLAQVVTSDICGIKATSLLKVGPHLGIRGSRTEIRFFALMRYELAPVCESDGNN